MASVERLIAWTRQKLDFPELSRSTLVQAIWDRNQFFLSQMKNVSNEGYLLRQFSLIVSPGQSQYPVSAQAPDFAGLFLVTTDPAFYQDGRVREVQYGRIQDANYAAMTSETFGPWFGQPDSLNFVACYNDPDQGGWQLRTYPINRAQGYYTCYYEPTLAGNTALQNEPQMPACWQQLLAVATALDVLGQCSWTGMTVDESRAKRADLLPGLERFRAEMEPEWKHWLLMANAAHTGIRTPYSSTPGLWGYWRGGWGY